MTRRSFRRWFACALLVLLPLQSMWAVAASYCAHQQDTSSHHFGHHEHRHAGAKAEPGPSADAASTAAGGDVDCPACHLLCAQVVPAFAISVVAPVPDRWFARARPGPGVLVRSAIERPNWNGLA